MNANEPLKMDMYEQMRLHQSHLSCSSFSCNAFFSLSAFSMSSLISFFDCLICCCNSFTWRQHRE